MTEQEQKIKSVYTSIAAYSKSEDLFELAKMVQAHEHAAAHLGLSAQVVANDDVNYTCRQIAKEMAEYYQERFIQSITRDVEVN